MTCCNIPRRSRAGIATSRFVHIADSNQARRHSAVGPSDRTIKTDSGKAPAVQSSTKLACGSIDTVSSGDGQHSCHSSRSREQARQSRVSVSNAHGVTSGVVIQKSQLSVVSRRTTQSSPSSGPRARARSLAAHTQSSSGIAAPWPVGPGPAQPTRASQPGRSGRESPRPAHRSGPSQ